MIEPFDFDLVRPKGEFGPRVVAGSAHDHKGLDGPLAGGQAVIAAGDGVVYDVTYDRVRGYQVGIQHEGDDARIRTRYHALSPNGRPRVGQRVREGERIGSVAAYAYGMGVWTGTHIHFETHVNGVPVNPREIIMASTDLILKGVNNTEDKVNRTLLGINNTEDKVNEVLRISRLALLGINNTENKVNAARASLAALQASSPEDIATELLDALGEGLAAEVVSKMGLALATARE